MRRSSRALGGCFAVFLALGVAGVAHAEPSPAGGGKTGVARLEGRWVSASTSPNVDDWVVSFEPRARYTEHTPGGGDVGGSYALVGGRGDSLTIRITLRLRRITLRTRFRVDISPDGQSITMTSENTPNEPRVFRRAPPVPNATP